MRLEPALGLVVVGAEPGNFGPKSTRMIHMPQMREFMQNDVVAYRNGRLDKTPIQRDIAMSGTGTPS